MKAMSARPATGSTNISPYRRNRKMNNTFYEGQHHIYKDSFAPNYDIHEKDEFNQNIPLWR